MSSTQQGPGNQNPSHEGPEGESAIETPRVSVPEKRHKELEPIPGPGAPMVPDHQNIDSNPIDPRVF